MSTTRRWYIYLISAISLQAVTWALIALLRNMFVFNLDPLAVAFQIAVIIIGLPAYIIHWMWAQRSVEKSDEERGSALRRAYLYGMMATFLGSFIANAFSLVSILLGAADSVRQQYSLRNLPTSDLVIYHLIAIIILGLLWFYHQRVTRGDSKEIPETGNSATVRRLYVYGFSAAGLTMVTLAIIHLLRWVMLQFGDSLISSDPLNVGITEEITRLIVGLPLWLVFWGWAQRLFEGPNEEERASALRKFYLYGAIFIGAMSVIISGTGILAGLFRQLLNLPPEGDIRLPLPIIIGGGILWAYHAYVLRQDAQVEETRRQARVRRLYYYLIAGIGLSALLVGLGGIISVILLSFEGGFGTVLREMLAWYMAALLAGLPVWLIPWRQVQAQAVLPGEDGSGSRRSVVRKIYLYFFLFIAMMAILSSLVYIVWRILSMLLGEDPPAISEFGHAISISIIAVGVLLYHGSVLRADRKFSLVEDLEEIEGMSVIVADVGDGHFGRAIVEGLGKKIPAMEPSLILLNSPDAVGDDPSEDGTDMAEQLAQAGLIIAPWEIVVPGAGSASITADVARGVTDSPARKLLVPTRSEKWEWAGVDRWSEETLVEQTIHAVKQIVDGEPVKAHRPMNVWSIVAIVLGVIFLLLPLSAVLIYLYSF